MTSRYPILGPILPLPNGHTPSFNAPPYPWFDQHDIYAVSAAFLVYPVHLASLC